ncbi:MAG: hypothetical protein AAF430_11435 [Myxococcota bacterium]
MNRMRSLTLVLALGIGIFAAPLAAAPTQQDPRMGAMEEIFFLSGLESQLASFSDVVDHSLVTQGQTLPQTEREALRRAMRRIFDGKALRQDVRKGLIARYDSEHSRATLAWLRSPLGRQITRLEEAASKPEVMPQMAAYAQKLLQNPPPESRLNLIQRLNEASGAMGLALDLGMTTAQSVAEGLNEAQPVDRRIPAEQLRAAIQQQRSAMEAQLRSSLHLSSLFAYRNLEDAQIESYLTFIESDAGRWYHSAVVAELVATLERAAGGAGVAVAQEMRAGGAVPASIAP